MWNEYINAEPHKSTIYNIISKSSRIGEQNEKMVIDFLHKNGWNIEWIGGNGSIVDQIFHSDVCAISPNGVFKSIQIKTVNSIIPVRLIQYENVVSKGLVYNINVNGTLYPPKVVGYNLMVFVTSEGKIIGTEKQKSLNEINGVMQFNDEDNESFIYEKEFYIHKPFENLISSNLIPDPNI